ncbi:MAG: transposase [Elusimicrobia bacterium]|nr:transposase [Elusimicrobiota bacterium]
MPRKRYSEEQIAGMLKENEAGISAVELCRKYGMSQNTFYKWKQKFGGMEVSDIRRLRCLEDENRRLKQIVADLTLDNQALKAINGKNW